MPLGPIIDTKNAVIIKVTVKGWFRTERSFYRIRSCENGVAERTTLVKCEMDHGVYSRLGRAELLPRLLSATNRSTHGIHARGGSTFQLWCAGSRMEEDPQFPSL